METQTKFIIQKCRGEVWENITTKYNNGEACTYAHTLANQKENLNIPFRVLETTVCEVYRVRSTI